MEIFDQLAAMGHERVLLCSNPDVGLRAIIAVIDAENSVSIRLHARFGFEKVGYFRQVGFKFDRWTVEKGKADIADAAKASTTVVLKAGDARIKASFKPAK